MGAEADRTYMLWLAMCHARLGDRAEARYWLERGTRWLNEALEREPGDPAVAPLEWHQRWWLSRLRAEAEQVVNGSR